MSLIEEAIPRGNMSSQSEEGIERSRLMNILQREHIFFTTKVTKAVKNARCLRYAVTSNAMMYLANGIN